MTNERLNVSGLRPAQCCFNCAHCLTGIVGRYEDARDFFVCNQDDSARHVNPEYTYVYEQHRIEMERREQDYRAYVQEQGYDPDDYDALYRARHTGKLIDEYDWNEQHPTTFDKYAALGDAWIYSHRTSSHDVCDLFQPIVRDFLPSLDDTLTYDDR